MKRKNIRLVSILAAAVLFAIGAFNLQSPEIFRCYFVGASSSFDGPVRNIYFSSDTPGPLRDSVLSLLDEADKRVCEFWNADRRTGNPVIIFCNSKSLFSDYSRRAGIVTYKTPLNCYIVFGEGYVDLDMVSHELLHTELYARTGYFTNSDLPTWFDEGLAMQADYRKEYSEQHYLAMHDTLSNRIRLSHISTPELFYTGDYYSHFVFAKHEVSSWLSKVQKNGLHELIQRINDGEEFQDVYENVLIKGNNHGQTR